MTTHPTAVPELGVGMIGYAFMGKAHSQGWRNARSFFSPPALPRLAVIAGRHPDALSDVARRFGWESTETDWRAVIERDDVDIVDICTPGDTHAEIAIAALEAGKHVLCEKPLANTVAEAEAMVAAADRAAASGVKAMVGFTYRRVPAIAHAREIVASGRLGTLHHVRAQYLQDWLADPSAPLSWRLQKERAGSGALGDIGAHIVDLVQFITGDRLTGVSALLETFVHQRPVSLDSHGLSATGSGTEMGEVTVDDAAVFLSRLEGGALATFEATRFATGRKNSIRIELNGSDGSLAFDFEDLNVLHVLDGRGADSGFTRVVVTEPEHPYLSGWWPPGHMLGYEHGFTHQAVDFLSAIAEDHQPHPNFRDGLGIQRVLDAVAQSATQSAVWTPINLERRT
ncbi:Gfo/Idh/MocA family oxidoreductase [Tessaracoccus sp. MC1865]|uniref:Gfo/Idh/MocA family protein n=1 Tax=Tessaracoccus sp. MC1865 TaxID=2760310 RepID=UPI0016018115|nr:Gfo/Idh/MocA family oxidoreductase [Tessaracoccus sp. MC1865]MBB1482949.1 Gfo/Idh/MocA family oxidoreductase [Tessaracoccus sp. MC1865]QTO37613.1 Gfo/Idh/MocA family oxidoreductase [Tessaracoccus sp. MC1865]